MMKLGKALSLGIALMAGSASAFEGSGAHGGGALLCGDRVELLDLWEAGTPAIVTESGLEIERLDLPVEEQEQAAMARLERINPIFARQVAESLEVVRRGVRNIPAGTEISPPSDAENVFIKAGCRFVGIAKFVDDRNILWVDPALIQKMPNTDQAALWIHEAVYRALRLSDRDEDSVRARMFVGFLFSRKATSLELGASGAKNFTCSNGTNGMTAFVTVEANHNVRVDVLRILVFSNANAWDPKRPRWLMGAMSASFPARAIADILKGDGSFPGQISISEPRALSAGAEEGKTYYGRLIVNPNSSSLEPKGVYVQISLSPDFSDMNHQGCLVQLP